MPMTPTGIEPTAPPRIPITKFQ